MRSISPSLCFFAASSLHRGNSFSAWRSIIYLSRIWTRRIWRFLSSKLHRFIFAYLPFSWRRSLILLIIVFHIFLIVCRLDCWKVRITLLLLLSSFLHKQFDFFFNIFASIFYIICNLFSASWIFRIYPISTIFSNFLLADDSFSTWWSRNLTIDRRRSNKLSNWPLNRLRKLPTYLSTWIFPSTILDWLIRLYSSSNIINRIISLHSRNGSHRFLQLWMNNWLFVFIRWSSHESILYLLILLSFWWLDYLGKFFSKLISWVCSSHLIQILRLRGRLVVFRGRKSLF